MIINPTPLRFRTPFRQPGAKTPARCTIYGMYDGVGCLTFGPNVRHGDVAFPGEPATKTKRPKPKH